MTPRGVCRSCGAPIVWARTRAQKNIPLDPDPVDDGNINIIAYATNGTPIIEVHRTAVAATGAVASVTGPDRYRSHFVSCPHAAEHRRKR